MNLGDTLAKLRKHAGQAAGQAQKAAGQAQKAVVDNKHHIHGAVDTLGSVADKTTKGKYSDRIAKAGEKAKGMVDKLDTSATGTAAEAEGAEAAAAGGEGMAEGAEGAATAEASQAEGVFSGEANQAEGAAEGAVAEGEAVEGEAVEGEAAAESHGE